MKTILVPVDFTAVSERQLRTAALLATPETERIHLLHVDPPPARRGRPLRQGRSLKRNVLPEAAELDLLDGMMAELQYLLEHPKVNVTFSIGHGEARRRIPEIRGQLDADLIIMGSHGHHALYHLFFGSTAHSLLEHARVPVVVLPREEDSGLPPEQLSCLLVAVDFSDSTAGLIDQVGALAQQHDAEVHLLHVTPDPHSPHLMPPEAELMIPPDQNLQGDALEQLQGLAHAMSAPTGRVHLHVDAGPRGGIILRHARDTGADMICMGMHHHSAFYELLVGSITEGIVERTGLPVFAVPVPDS